ncbi:MAG: hypothetical protein FWB80_12875 [Defluviitaleaceae bacterium]|nr:hypothetical protein [Defluviitaleaceae bacterium]
MSNMVVRTNVFALNAHRNLTNVGLSQRTAAQRLSSGFRINSAADDAAGLAISESMRAQIRGLDQASINAQDAVGLIQTAEGAMATVSDMVIRIRELLVQASNDTYTSAQRGMIQVEIDQLMQEINDVTFRTEFNTRTLLAGGLTGGGGQTFPISLQWKLFDQARVVGIATDRGTLQPNNRNENSKRQDIINLQNEFNGFLKGVANRQINAGILNRSDFDFNFMHLSSFEPLNANTPASSEGNINILQSNGLTGSEVQQLRSLTNRLNNAVQEAVRTAFEIYEITNDQIRALGGRAASNNDGTNVFINAAMDDWFINHYLNWEQLYSGGEAYFTWYQGGFDADGSPNPLRNSAFTELYPEGRNGASESLWHVVMFTGMGMGIYPGVSPFDEIVENIFNIQANVTSTEPTDTPEMAYLNRAFRLLVGFEMKTGERVAAHTDLRIPYAQQTSLTSFSAAWESEAAARRSLMAINHAIGANNFISGSVYPQLGALITLRDSIMAITPPFTPGSPAMTALNAAGTAIATLNGMAIPPPVPAGVPAALWNTVWGQLNSVISNANAHNIIAASNAYFANTPALTALAGLPSISPAAALPATVINAITAVGGVITGSPGVGLNIPPFNVITPSLTDSGVAGLPLIGPTPSPPLPAVLGTPTNADPPGIPAAGSIGGLPTVPGSSAVNYVSARQAATNLVNAHTLYTNNRIALLSVPTAPITAGAPNPAIEAVRQAAQNLRGILPMPAALNVVINTAIGVGNNAGAYGALRAAEANFLDYTHPNYQNQAVFNAAVNAFNAAIVNVTTNANATVSNLYTAFQTAATAAHTATTNVFASTINSFRTAANNVITATVNARTNANMTAYNAALVAYAHATRALDTAIHAANNSVEANAWESLSAIIVPSVPGPPWPVLAPGQSPFPGISNPPSPQLTRSDVDFDSPVAAAYIAARNALAAFSPGPGQAHNLPMVFPPVSPPTVRTTPPRSTTLPAPASPQTAAAPPLSTGTLLSPSPIPPWTAPGTNALANTAVSTGGTTVIRGASGQLYRSMMEAKQAESTPFDIPRYGFVSRLESLLDKALGAFGTVNLEGNAMWFQTGANVMQGTVLQLKGMHTGILGGGRGDLSLLIDARESNGIHISEQLEIIDRAEGIINSQRAQLGAVQNRLEFTRQSVDISSENLSTAESRIRDTDMALEMMRFTQAQVLQQAGIAMLAQANQLPSAILQLLQ